MLRVPLPNAPKGTVSSVKVARARKDVSDHIPCNSPLNSGNSQHSPDNSTLTVVSWNCRTLDPLQHASACELGLGICGKATVVDSELQRCSCDAMALQEARFRTEGRFQTQAYVVLSAPAAHGTRGVQIWISKRWSRDIRGSKVYSDRLMSCIVLMQGRLFCILSAHAPLVTDTEENREAFWKLLATAVSHAPESATLLLCGDFNARVSASSHPAIVGPISSPAADVNGWALAKQCHEIGLVPINTWLGTQHTRYTYQSQGRHSQIDYICAKAALAPLVLSTSIQPFSLIAMLESDHLAITIVFRVTGERLAAKPVVPRFPRRWDYEVSYQYAIYAATEMTRSQPQSLLQRMSTALQAAKACRRLLANTGRTQRSSWIASDTHSQLADSAAANKQYLQARAGLRLITLQLSFNAWLAGITDQPQQQVGIISRGSLCEARAVEASLLHAHSEQAVVSKNMIRRDKRAWTHTIGSAVDTACRGSDWSAAFRLVKQLGPRSPVPLPGIADSSGKVLTDASGIERCWNSHWASLFKGQTLEGYVVTPLLTELARQGATPSGEAPLQFAPEDVERVLACMPKGKGVGADLIPAELWSAMLPMLRDDIAALWNSIVSTRVVPESWRGASSTLSPRTRGTLPPPRPTGPSSAWTTCARPLSGPSGTCGKPLLRDPSCQLSSAVVPGLAWRAPYTCCGSGATS